MVESGQIRFILKQPLFFHDMFIAIDAVKVGTMDLLELEIITQYKDVLGAEIFQQTVDLYVEQSDKYINKLEQAISDSSYDAWQDSCHILKSASGNTGLKCVFAKVSELEYSKRSFTEFTIEVEALKVLNQQSISAIKKWLAQ